MRQSDLSFLHDLWRYIAYCYARKSRSSEILKWVTSTCQVLQTGAINMIMLAKCRCWQSIHYLSDLILTFSTSASCLCCIFSFSSWCLDSRTLIFISIWKHIRKNKYIHVTMDFQSKKNICLRVEILVITRQHKWHICSRELNIEICVLSLFRDMPWKKNMI